MVALDFWSGAAPALIVCRMSISTKASSPGGFSLDFSHQPALAEVPGSPLVTGLWCGGPQGSMMRYPTEWKGDL